MEAECFLLFFSLVLRIKIHQMSLSNDDPISPIGHLKIEEVYYSGAVPTEGIDRYYADQFIQLRNTSDYTLDIGGVGIW